MLTKYQSGLALMQAVEMSLSDIWPTFQVILE
jgi:hypothetical protein